MWLKPFLWYALGAYLIGVPFALWRINRWLEQFAYRVSLSVVDLLLPLGVLLAIVIVMVGLQALLLLRSGLLRFLKTE